MANPGKAKLPSDWRRISAAQDAELEEYFGGEYNLQVSPADLMAITAKANKKGDWSFEHVDTSGALTRKEIRKAMRSSKYILGIGAKTGKMYRNIVDEAKLQHYLRDTKLGPNHHEQEQTIKHISDVAAQSSGAPAELFEQGYALYIKIALATNKISDFKPTYEQIMNMPTFTNRPHQDLYDLEQTTRDKLPHLAEFIDRKLFSFSPFGDFPEGTRYDDVTYPHMLLAGAGLAYNHCYQIVSESGAAALAAIQEPS